MVGTCVIGSLVSVVVLIYSTWAVTTGVQLFSSFLCLISCSETFSTTLACSSVCLSQALNGWSTRPNKRAFFAVSGFWFAIYLLSSHSAAVPTSTFVGLSRAVEGPIDNIYLWYQMVLLFLTPDAPRSGCGWNHFWFGLRLMSYATTVFFEGEVIGSLVWGVRRWLPIICCLSGRVPGIGLSLATRFAFEREIAIGNVWEWASHPGCLIGLLVRIFLVYHNRYNLWTDEGGF